MPMKVLLVCGPWSSETTAVAGLLAQLGAVGFGPYLRVNDPIRPNTYEFIPFRDALRRFISEETLSLAPDAEREVESILRLLRKRIERQEFGPYNPDSGPPIFLKHPLSALVLPQICAVFDTKLIYVLRPLAEIERTRLRRRWGAQLGRQGAEVVYPAMFDNLVEQVYPTMILRYAELMKAPAKVAQELVQFAGLTASPAQIKAAAAFVNSPKDKLLPRNWQNVQVGYGSTKARPGRGSAGDG
jgi:hypothetical protein